MNSTTLVTGSTGLVGSHLLYRLVYAGEKVRAGYRNTRNIELTKKIFGYYSANGAKLFRAVEWVECDLCDYEKVSGLMDGITMVYHCAAIVSFDNDQAGMVINNNVKVTSNIVRSCLEKGVEKLCHVSSTAAIGSSDFEDMVNENHTWSDSDRHSAYAMSKHLSEAEVWKGIQRGLKAVIVNPSVIFGPGDWNRGSSRYFSIISKGIYFYTGGVTGYVDVNDVTLAMTALMNSDHSGERYIVSSENLSFGEVFTLIAQSLNKRKPFIYVPKELSLPVVSILNFIYGLSGTKFPVTKENIRSAYSKVYYDNSKVISATGMTFKKISESVADTCRIYKMEAAAYTD